MTLHQALENTGEYFDQYFFYCEPRYQPGIKGYLLAAVENTVSGDLLKQLVGNSSLVSIKSIKNSYWVVVEFSNKECLTIKPSCWVDDLPSFDKVFAEEVKMCTPLNIHSTWWTLIKVGLFSDPKMEIALKAFQEKEEKVQQAKKKFSEVMIELGAKEETEEDEIFLPFTSYHLPGCPVNFPLGSD